MIQVEHLTEKDYDEALFMLNRSFSFKENHPETDLKADFEKSLPIMWTREHDYMKKHLVVRENDRIAALLGVYPLPVCIAGHDLTFATIGNVATLPEYRGKNYMRAIMTEAVREAREAGIDAARLGGLRSRYNRYGFEHAGSIYKFTLTARNAKEHPPRAFAFAEVNRDDAEAVDFMRACQRRNGIYALRETRLDFYMTLRAWENRPVLALMNGRPAGYLCVSPDGGSIAEFGAADGVTPSELCAAWLLANGLESVAFEVEPAEKAAVRDALGICESWTLETPSMFNVMRWDRVAGALLDLRCRMSPLPEGEAVVGIEGWGNVKLSVGQNCGRAERTDAPAQIALGHLEAMRFLFGPLDPAAVADIPAGSPLAAWLPLPLSWNGQDRV